LCEDFGGEEGPFELGSFELIFFYFGEEGPVELGSFELIFFCIFSCGTPFFECGKQFSQARVVEHEH